MNTTIPASPVVHCDYVLRVASIETPLITDLVAAMSHLESAAKRAGSPAAEAQAACVSEDVYGDWVQGNAARIRAALDRITAAYTAPAATAPAP